MLLFVCLWLGLVTTGRSRMFSDPGTFWHTVLGEKFLQQHQLTVHDSFSYTYFGEPWLALQWLADWAMAAAHGWSGWDTLLLATAGILAAFYAWIAARCVNRGLHPVLATLLVFLTLAASSHHFLVRPHLGSIVFLGLYFALLCDVDSGRVRPVRLVWLVPLTVVWTNIHGGVLAGVATLGLAITGWMAWAIAHRLLRNPAEDAREETTAGELPPALRIAAPWPTPLQDWSSTSVVSLAGAACLAAMLVNPYGPQMVSAWLAIMQMPLTGLIDEHRPLDIVRPEGLATIVLGLGYLALLSNVAKVQGYRRLRISWLLPAIWLLLAASRVRHAPLFAAVAALASAEMLPYSALGTWLARFELFSAPQAAARRMSARAKAMAGIVPLSLAVAALALQAGRVPLPVLGSDWAQLDQRRWPLELLPELKALEADALSGNLPAAPDAREDMPRPPRLFHSLDYGGFLIYHAPQLKTFIDDRCELFGTEFLAEYCLAERERPERIDTWDEQYRFDAALVRAGSPFDRFLSTSPEWALIRRGDAAAFYRKRANVGDRTSSSQMALPPRPYRT